MTSKNKGKSKNKNELIDDNIRLIKSKNDWKQLIEMTRENFPEFIEKVLEEGLEYHQQKDNFLFGKFTKEKILGTIGIRIVSTRNLGIIGYLQVKKEYRKQGIAKELLTRIKSFSLKKDCRYLYLAVYANNKTANAIYQHWGFKQVPMIYNIGINSKIWKGENKNTKSKRNLISQETRVNKIIDDLFSEYYLLDKVEHYFSNIHYHYTKNNVYSRRINKKDIIIVLKFENEITVIYALLLMKNRENTIMALKEELDEIRNKNVNKKKNISVIGKLTQDDINELMTKGLNFEISQETNGYLLEL